jgi:hypothetical protein
VATIGTFHGCLVSISISRGCTFTTSIALFHRRAFPVSQKKSNTSVTDRKALFLDKASPGMHCCRNLT